MRVIDATLLAQQDQAATVLERLDPTVRAALLMVLVGLIIVGLVLVVMVMIGGRWVRRGPRSRPAPKDYADQRHAPRPDAAPRVEPNAPLAGETLAGRSTSETTLHERPDG